MSSGLSKPVPWMILWPLDSSLHSVWGFQENKLFGSNDFHAFRTSFVKNNLDVVETFPTQISKTYSILLNDKPLVNICWLLGKCKFSSVVFTFHPLLSRDGNICWPNNVYSKVWYLSFSNPCRKCFYDFYINFYYFWTGRRSQRFLE